MTILCRPVLNANEPIRHISHRL
jgi:hypothetical protein